MKAGGETEVGGGGGGDDDGGDGVGGWVTRVGVGERDAGGGWLDET